MFQLVMFSSPMFRSQEQNQVPSLFVANDATGRGWQRSHLLNISRWSVKLCAWSMLSNRFTAVEGVSVEPKPQSIRQSHLACGRSFSATVSDRYL